MGLDRENRDSMNSSRKERGRVNNSKGDPHIEVVKRAFSRDPPPKPFTRAEWDVILEKSTEVYNLLMDTLQSINPPDMLTTKTLIPILSAPVYAAIMSCTHTMLPRERHLLVIDFVADIIHHQTQENIQDYT